jgi:ribokinase
VGEVRFLHLAVGRINIDVTVRLDSLPAEGENANTDVFEISIGGAAANYSMAVAALGHSASLIAKVSKDELIKVLMRALAEKGVILDHVIEVEGPQSSALILLRKGGKISIVRRTGVSSLLSPSDYRYLVPLFDVVHYASVPPQLVLPKDSQRLVTYDPGPYASEAVVETKVDVLFCNEIEFSKIGERTEARSIVVKMGERGAKVVSGGIECVANSYPVEEVIDTTGAGDVFDATFNSFLVSGADIKEALAAAVVASGLKVTRLGTSNPPTYGELMSAMAKGKVKVECK